MARQFDLFKDASAWNERHEYYLVWREKNDDVFKLIEDVAVSMMNRGRRFSIYAVMHHVRFNEYFKNYRDEPYRLSNNHGPYIARELVRKYPAMAQFIQLKRVVGQDRDDEE